MYGAPVSPVEAPPQGKYRAFIDFKFPFQAQRLKVLATTLQSPAIHLCCTLSFTGSSPRVNHAAALCVQVHGQLVRNVLVLRYHIAYKRAHAVSGVEG